MDKANKFEFILYLKNRPVTTIFLEIIGLCGKIVYIPYVGYIVNDAALAKQILNDPAFTTTAKGSIGGMINSILGDYTLFNTDGDVHRRLKQLVKDVFARKHVEVVVRETLNELLGALQDDLEAGKQIDIVYFVRQMSNIITFRLLGCAFTEGQTADTCDEVSALTARLTALLAIEKMAPSAADIAAGKECCNELLAIVRKARASAPVEGESLIGRLAQGGLTTPEIEAMVILFLMAGTETISVAIPRLLALLLDTSQFAKLATHPELLDQTVEEGLRMISPSPAILRGVGRDTVLAGRRFKKDRRVTILLYTLLKQRFHLREPRRFDIEREPGKIIRHLWFGDGPHFCPGFSLATQEITGVFNTLLSLQGDLKIVKRRYPKGAAFPGYQSLIVELKK